MLNSFRKDMDAGDQNPESNQPRNHHIRLFFLICILLSCFIVQCYAVTGTETLISTGTYDTSQVTPSVSGNYIAWSDQRDATNLNVDIYVLDLLTGQESSVTNFGENIFFGVTASTPSLSGSNVVWSDDRNGNKDIFLYSLPAGPEQQVTDDGADQEHAVISPDTIVWQDNRNRNWDIYSCTMPGCTPGSETQITNNAGDQTNPAIYEDTIVWQDDRNGNWDIYTYNLVTLTESRITTNAANQIDPAISGNYIVWSDDRSIHKVIYSYDISGSVESPVTSSSPDAIKPKIDGDRIVWEDGRNGAKDIYLFTIGSPVQCPVADFTVSPMEGHAPFNVILTLPVGLNNPLIYKVWDINDGTLTQPFNPPYTIPAAGIYDVRLTVGTPKCRNATTPVCPYKVFADTPPIVRFIATPKYGFAPLQVSFSDLSCGEPNSWLWNFGDGATSTIQNPTHTYNNPGTEYTVRLDTNNPNGGVIPNFSAVLKYIRTYLGTSDTATLPVTGIISDNRYGKPFIDYDITLVPDYIASPTLLISRPPIGFGWENITIYSEDGMGLLLANGHITGNFSAIRLETKDILTTNGTRTIDFNYKFNTTDYTIPSSVNTEIWEGATPDDETQFTSFAFKIPPTGFTSISDIPFTAHVTKNSIQGIGNATINMSIDSNWYDTHSGAGTIALIGIGTLPNGTTVGIGIFPIRNRIDGIDYFYGDAPLYLTKFALAQLSGTGNVFQFVYLGIAQHFEASTSSDSDSTTGPAAGGKSGGAGLTSQQNQPQLNPAQPSPPSPAATSVNLFINDQGVVTQTTVLQSSDQLAEIAIGQGVTALGPDGTPLSSVSINPLTADQISGMSSSGTLTFAGLAYNFQPDDATFSPAVTITFTVPNAQWNQQYTIREFDPTTNSWKDLPTTYHPESGTISSSVSNFCCIALFSDAIQTKPVAAPTTIAVKPSPLPTPAPTNSLGFFYNLMVFIANLAIKNFYLVLIVIAIFGALYLKGRRKRRDKIRYYL